MGIYATWAHKCLIATATGILWESFDNLKEAPTAAVPQGKYRDRKPYGLGIVTRHFDDSKLLHIMSTRKPFPLGQIPRKCDGKDGNGSCVAIISE